MATTQSGRDESFVANRIDLDELKKRSWWGKSPTEKPGDEVATMLAIVGSIAGAVIGTAAVGLAGWGLIRLIRWAWETPFLKF